MGPYGAHGVQNIQKDKYLRIGGTGGQNRSWVCRSMLPLIGPPQLPPGVKIWFLSFVLVLVAFHINAFLGCSYYWAPDGLDYFRLHEMPPTTRDASYHRRCLLLNEMPPTTRDASNYKRCLRVQEMPPTTRDASDNKRCLQLQERPPTTRDASDLRDSCDDKPNTLKYETHPQNINRRPESTSPLPFTCDYKAPKYKSNAQVPSPNAPNKLNSAK